MPDKVQKEHPKPLKESSNPSEEAPDEKPMVVGFAAHELSKRMHCYLQNRSVADGEDPVVLSHGWLIGYLYQHEDEEIYQRDLEDELHLAKSSIATILQTLEQGGYIRREVPDHDARQKRVVLTDAGRVFEQKMRVRIEESERQVCSGISDEDMAVFTRVMRRMLANMS